MSLERQHFGVRIAGCGSSLPDKRMTNADLERLMETSDDWIVQRTGILERRVSDCDEGPTTTDMATGAMQAALDDAGLASSELDLILTATMTPDMPTPGVAPLVSNRLGCSNIAAMDINAACSGFVFAINVAHAMIQTGLYRTVGLIGADTITRFVDYSTHGRSAAILFGDAGAAFVLRADDDRGVGLIAQSMHADGGGAKHLLIPCHKRDFPTPESYDERGVERVYMNGQAVFKFAVKKFPEVIEQTLEKAGVAAGDVDHYVCHQANARILEAARERFGLEPERLTVNIDRLGNTVAASCPLVFDELKREGRVQPGQKVMFIAFGAGLTWGASLWQL